MTEKLMPCPFCGGPGDIESQPSYSQAANTYARYRGWCDQCGFGLDWHSHELDAATAWNTRQPTPAADEVEAVARAIEVAMQHASIGQGWEYFAPHARAAIAAMQAKSAEPVVSGWIVGNGNADKWRAIDDTGNWTWIESRDEAIRYARRTDAEKAHAEDEDAWRVEPYPAEPAGEEPVALGFREWLAFSLHQARYNHDALDPKAAEIIANVLARYDATPSNPERLVEELEKAAFAAHEAIFDLALSDTGNGRNVTPAQYSEAAVNAIRALSAAQDQGEGK